LDRGTIHPLNRENDSPVYYDASHNILVSLFALVSIQLTNRIVFHSESKQTGETGVPGGKRGI